MTAIAVGAAFGATRAWVIGPASMNPDVTSRFFFRSKASAKLFPVASVALVLTLAGLLVAEAF